MCSKRGIALALAASILTEIAPAHAQDPLARAVARFDQQMVSIMERALTQHTERVTTILYLRRVAGGARDGRYCGEGVFGSDRDRFIVDMTENMVVRGPSNAVWERASCNARLPDAHTLIDVR